MEAQSNHISPREQKIMLPGTTDTGEPILSVLVKRTYTLENGMQAVRKNSPSPLAVSDTYLAEPLQSSLLYESDFIPYKKQTDILFSGNAYTTNTKPVYELEAEFCILGYRKRLMITGDRTCTFRSIRSPVFSDPKPFTHMPITYERAFGGIDFHETEEPVYVYPSNSLGKGFIVMDREEPRHDMALPNIEDPDNVITPQTVGIKSFEQWKQQPKPVGLLPIPRHWYQRARYCGILPSEWKMSHSLKSGYAHSLPTNQSQQNPPAELDLIDFSFFNCASEGLSIPYIRGNEVVRLTHLASYPVYEFQLPNDHLHISIDIGRGVEEPEIKIHTVSIIMEKHEMDIVYRGAIGYSGPDSLQNLTDCMIQISE